MQAARTYRQAHRAFIDDRLAANAGEPLRWPTLYAFFRLAASSRAATDSPSSSSVAAEELAPGGRRPDVGAILWGSLTPLDSPGIG